MNNYTGNYRLVTERWNRQPDGKYRHTVLSNGVRLVDEVTDACPWVVVGPTGLGAGVGTGAGGAEVSDWDGWREGAQEKHRQQLAESDTSGFRQCSPWHYQREVGGSVLDWWPSTRRWRWRGKTYYGACEALQGFIRRRDRAQGGRDENVA